MKHYETGLVVGRFQPFHKGHRYLIKEALEFTDKLIIGVGSINQDDLDNPLSFDQVKDLLAKFFKEEGINNRLSGIQGIPDFFDDKKWGDYVISKLPLFDVVISNNNWTNRILKDSGYPVVEVPFFKRELYQGKYIRELFRKAKPWGSRVPKYLTSDTKKLLH